MDRTIQHILGLTDGEIAAEEALFFIYEKYKLYGDNPFVVKMLDSWFHYICDTFDDDTVFYFGKMAIKDLDINFPNKLTVHEKLGPIVQRCLEKEQIDVNAKKHFSYDSYEHKDTMDDRWTQDEFGISFRNDK